MVHYRPSVEQPDSEYPFVLTTGRMLFQYHTGSMTRRSRAIEAVAGSPYVEMNGGDALRLSIRSGDQVVVRSRRGAITLPAKISRRTDHGVVFIPFHFREAAANVLTNSTALDPVCKIPELKVATVAVEKAEQAGGDAAKRR